MRTPRLAWLTESERLGLPVPMAVVLLGHDLLTRFSMANPYVLSNSDGKGPKEKVNLIRFINLTVSQRSPLAFFLLSSPKISENQVLSFRKLIILISNTAQQYTLNNTFQQHSQQHTPAAYLQLFQY